MAGWLIALGILMSATALADAPQAVYGANCRHSATAFNCVEYLRNYDGDTITVNIPGVPVLIGDEITVRVNGIDAPEIEGRNACERKAAVVAQQTAQELLQDAKRIDLRNVQRDKYFRVLADVYIDGDLLSKILLKEKLAVSYDGGHKELVDWCP